MKRLILFLCFGIVAHAKPSLHPIHEGVGAIYKGPNSETIIKGPDGSIITSEAIGGAVEVNAQQNIVAQVTAGPTAIASAVVQSSSLSHAPIVVEEIPTVVTAQVVSQPIVASNAVLSVPVVAKGSTSLEGPSGSILRLGEDAIISGPASTTIKQGQHVASIPNVEIDAIAVPAPIVENIAVVTAQPSIAVNAEVLTPQIASLAPDSRRLIDAGLINGIAQEQIIRNNAANAELLLARQQAALAAQIANGAQLPQNYSPVTFAPDARIYADERIRNEVLLSQEAERNALAQALASDPRGNNQLVLSNEAERNALAQAIASGAIANSDGRIANGVQLVGEAERNALAQAIASDAIANSRGRIENGLQLAGEAERNALAQALATSAVNGRIDSGLLLAKEAERNALAQALATGAVDRHIGSGLLLANEAERNVLTQALASGAVDERVDDRLLLANEAERNALAINSGYSRPPQGFVDRPGYESIRDPSQQVLRINPVITQGDQVISDGNSATLGPVGNIASSTLGPVGNIAVPSTLRPPPGYQYSTTPVAQIPARSVILSSTPQPGYVPNRSDIPLGLRPNIHDRRPIIMLPDGLRPNVGAGLASNGPSTSDVAEWRASVANGYTVAEAVLPKQVYNGLIH